MILKDVKDMIRAPYAWPGGYRKTLLMDDGECLCADCVKAEFRNIVHSAICGIRDGWNPVAVFIQYEGESIICAHCGESIDSEYGNPEND